MCVVSISLRVILTFNGLSPECGLVSGWADECIHVDGPYVHTKTHDKHTNFNCKGLNQIISISSRVLPFLVI